jgi:PKD repeat protein
VKFVSQSINGNDVLWDFGVVGISTDTSTKSTTKYTYPQAGIYTVSLIVNPGDPCSDTATFDFDVKPYVDVDIEYSGVNCFEVQGFEFEAVGFWPTNATLSWLISPGANISTWNGQLHHLLPGASPVCILLSLLYSGGRIVLIACLSKLM